MTLKKDPVEFVVLHEVWSWNTIQEDDIDACLVKDSIYGSVHEILSSLTEKGFLEYIPDKNHYILTQSGRDIVKAQVDMEDAEAKNDIVFNVSCGLIIIRHPCFEKMLVIHVEDVPKWVDALQECAEYAKSNEFHRGRRFL